MHNLLTLALFLGSTFAPCYLPPGSIPPYETFTFTQMVDHFNYYTTPLTYSQRYLIWADCWQGPPNPILFYAGNEGDITSFWNNTGFVFELAYHLGSLVVFGEHRYYGTSAPLGDHSWDKPNIGYLSSEQAIADYVKLIPEIKEIYGGEESPVLVFGGSYGGMLAAWMRAKYPYVVAGALAASAPVVSIGGDFEIPFFDIITNDFAMYDPQCPDIVRAAYLEIDSLSKSPAGLKTISEKMLLCSPLQSEQVEHLKLWIANSFVTLAMVNYPYPSNFMGSLPAWPVKVACQLLLTPSTTTQSTVAKSHFNIPPHIDLLRNIAMAAGLSYNGTNGDLACYDIFSEFIFCSDQTGCGGGTDGLSWDYQACTETFFLVNTNFVTDMFPPRQWTISDLTNYCQKTWDVSPRPDWIKTLYGRAHYEAASNIIFSNGNLDPWHAGGILRNISDTIVSIMVDNGAHHLDLRASNLQDPQSLIEVRGIEAMYLEKWATESQGMKLGDLKVRVPGQYPWAKVWWEERKKNSSLLTK